LPPGERRRERVNLRWHPYEGDLGNTGSRKPRRQKQGRRIREQSARYAEPILSRELPLSKLEKAGIPLA
jgi:hypothetical protein